jgi:hypothetical protein
LRIMDTFLAKVKVSVPYAFQVYRSLGAFADRYCSLLSRCSGDSAHFRLDGAPELDSSDRAQRPA